MAVYRSNGNGNWSVIPWLTSGNGRGPWQDAGPGGLTGPISDGGDKIVISPGNTVTYNVKGVWGDNLSYYAAGTSVALSASNAIVVSPRATLKASRTENSELTARGNMFVSPASGCLDWGTEADPLVGATSKIVLNYVQDYTAPPGTLTNQTSAAAGTCGIFIGTLASSTVAGPVTASFVGKPKTRNTPLVIEALATSNQLQVTDITGWENGDKIYLESPDTFVYKVTSTFIQSIDTPNKIITIFPPLQYTLPAGTYIGNFSSNIVVESYNPLFPSYGIFASTSIGSVFKFKDLLTRNMGRGWATISTALISSVAQYPDRIASIIGTTLNTGAISIDVSFARSSYYIENCSHESLAPLGAGLRGYNITGQTSNDHYITNCNHYNNYGSGAGTANLGNYNAGSAGQAVDIQNRATAIVDGFVGYGSSYGLVFNAGFPFSGIIKNSRFHSLNSVIGSTSFALSFNLDSTLIKSQSGCLGFFDGVQSGTVNNCVLSSGVPNTSLITLSEDALAKITIKNSSTNATLSAVTNNITNTNALVSLENISGRVTLNNRKFNYFYQADVETSIRKRGLTSYRIRPLVANSQFNVYEQIPATAGTPLRIKGSLRTDGNYAGLIPISASFVGAGITPVIVDGTPARNTWVDFDLTLNPTITDPITFTLYGQVSALRGGFVYLDGVPFSPFVKTARHYGFLYDANIDRTINTLTTLTENQVSVLDNVNNLDYLYDAASYWTVSNPQLSSYLDLFAVNGSLLDFNSLDVIVNKDYWTGFHYLSTLNNPSNLVGGGTIILKTPVLSSGNNFNTIKTTGTIILSAGTLSDIDVNASITQDTPTSLSGVYMLNAAKTYTYNTNTATEVEFKDCNIYGLQNAGTAIVTVKKTGTTSITESDTEIVTYAPTLINLTLQGGYIALYDNTSTRQYYQNTDGTIVLPAAATGTWTYKIARYGYELVLGSFNINPATGGTVNIIPTYVPDTFITQADSTIVAAYTNLNTTAKIHDYISYIRTTSAGIDYGTLHEQSFGTLTFNYDLTLDATAASIFDYSGGVITLKSSSITDDIIYFVNGDFTQSNGNTISDGIKVRADNLDSEFYFNNVDSLIFFPTENDRNNNTNPGTTITSEAIFRFLYGATVSGVTFSGNAYIRVTVAGTTLLNTTPINQGSNTIDFGTTGNIQVIISNQKVINAGVQKASKLIPHTTNI